jgi:diguanylate cyclase (GGDEF)-like protein/PAS domain S-box-containing protein
MSSEQGPSPARATEAPRAGQDGATPRAHAALVDSEQRYRRLFETAKDGIFLLDAETGRITDVNPFLVEMLGYSHAELLGRELWEIGPVKDILASQQAVRHLQDKEYIRYENLPLETKSKQRVQVEFVSNVYLVDGARVIQCNVRDITARKLAEEAALAAHAELRALVAEMQVRDREMNRLNQMNDLLHACATQEEAFKVVALMAGDLFAGQSGFLATLNVRDQRLETVARWGDEPAIVPAFALSDCWGMRRGQPHEVVEPREGLVCQHFLDQPASGYLCVPLNVQGETLGLLCLIGSPSGAPRGTVARQLVVTMGEAIKLSLSNLRLREKLREQATLDVLTGLYNRRFLDESLARELHRATRRQSPLCVAMLDIDHFKRFNDSFGHEAGDALLRELGRLLRDKVRRSDISCRYGGEEFALVFPDSTLADTRKRVEELRAAVSSLDVRSGDQLLGKITLSAGIAQAGVADSRPSELLRAADSALYAAKQAGRDCIAVHRPEA